MPESRAFHETLVGLLNKKAPTEMEPLIEPLVNSGSLDLKTIVHSGYRNDEPFLARWLKTIAYYEWKDPNLDLIEAWAGKDWWALDCQGQPLIDNLMLAQNNGIPHIYMAPLIDRIPQDFWARWEAPYFSSNRVQGRLKGDTPYSAMMLWALQNERHRSTQDNSVYLSDHLIAKGWPLTGSVNGAPVASYLFKPEHWHAYLAQGGDPLVQVRCDSESTQTKPLWMALRDTHYQGMRATLEAWALEQPQIREQAAKDALRHYIKAMDRYGKAEIIQAVRSRADWLTVEDEHGHNVLMLISLLRTNDQSGLGAMETLTATKKGKALLHHQDRQGRNLWYFLLHDGSGKNAASMMRSLLDEGVTPSVDARGRGLLLQLAERPPRLKPVAYGTKDVFMKDRALESLSELKRAEAFDPQSWLSGSPEEATAFQQKVMEKTPGSWRNALHELGERLMDQGVSASWGGMWIVNALRSGSVVAKLPTVHRWLDHGAWFDPTQVNLGEMEKDVAPSISADEWAKICAKNTTNQANTLRAQARQETLEKLAGQPKVASPRRLRG